MALQQVKSGTIAEEVFSDKRRAREWQTVSAMLHIYCKAKHATTGRQLCQTCSSLSHYAQARLQRCVFGAEKPTCAKCPVHCYQPSRRSEMKDVMRFAGPRMLWKHPVLTVRHWVDGFAPAPPKP